MRLLHTILLSVTIGLPALTGNAAAQSPLRIGEGREISLEDFLRGANQRGKPGGLFSARGLAPAPQAPAPTKVVTPRMLIQQIAKPLRLTARQRSRLLTKLEWRPNMGTTPRAPEDDPATIDAILSVVEPDQAQAFLRLLGPDRVNKLRERTLARKMARRGMPTFQPPRPQPKLKAVPPRRDRPFGGGGRRGGRGQGGGRGSDLDALLRGGQRGGGIFF